TGLIPIPICGKENVTLAHEHRHFSPLLGIETVLRCERFDQNQCARHGDRIDRDATQEHRLFGSGGLQIRLFGGRLLVLSRIRELLARKLPKQISLRIKHGRPYRKPWREPDSTAWSSVANRTPHSFEWE